MAVIVEEIDTENVIEATDTDTKKVIEKIEIEIIKKVGQVMDHTVEMMVVEFIVVMEQVDIMEAISDMVMNTMF